MLSIKKSGWFGLLSTSVLDTGVAAYFWDQQAATSVTACTFALGVGAFAAEAPRSLAGATALALQDMMLAAMAGWAAQQSATLAGLGCFSEIRGYSAAKSTLYLHRAFWSSNSV